VTKDQKEILDEVLRLSREVEELKKRIEELENEQPRQEQAVSTEKIVRCSIDGCGEEVCDMEYGLSPYCSCHENDYGSEWQWCQVSDCFTIACQTPALGARCAVHGGADYVPRTTEGDEVAS